MGVVRTVVLCENICRGRKEEERLWVKSKAGGGSVTVRNKKMLWRVAFPFWPTVMSGHDMFSVIWLVVLCALNFILNTLIIWYSA